MAAKQHQRLSLDTKLSAEQIDSLLQSAVGSNPSTPTAPTTPVHEISSPPEAPSSSQRIEFRIPYASLMRRWGLKIVLGDADERVAETLRNHGYIFEVIDPKVDELDPRFTVLPVPEERAKAIAFAKTGKLAPKLRRKDKVLLITTGQVAVTHVGEVRSRPRDTIESAAFLRSLSNSCTMTVTALQVTNLVSGTSSSGIREAKIEFSDVPDQAILALAESNISLAAVGAMYIEHQYLARYVTSIEGTICSAKGMPGPLLHSLLGEVLGDSAPIMVKQREKTGVFFFLFFTFFFIPVAALTIATMFALWHFNMSAGGMHLGLLDLTTRHGIAAVTTHLVSLVINPTLSSIKMDLLAKVRGKVLELGPGLGENLRFYRKGDVNVTLLEPNFHMHTFIRQEAEDNGVPIVLLGDSAETAGMDLDDALEANSFDYVVSTLTLACVQDQNLALKRVHYLLKPGGRLLFLEQDGSPFGRTFRLIDWILAPIWRWASGGCTFGQEVLRRIQNAKGCKTRRVDQISGHLAGLGIPFAYGDVEKLL